MAPGTTRHHVEQDQRAPFEVLTGDVLQRLPARPQIHAVADLGIAGHGADSRVFEVRNQLRDRIHGDHGIGIDADVDLFVDALQPVIERRGLAAIGLA